MQKVQHPKYRIEERRKIGIEGAYRTTWVDDLDDRDEALRRFRNLVTGLAGFGPAGSHRLVLLGPDRRRI